MNFRFSTEDENYNLSGTDHVWELGLQLHHTKVGLSSFHIQLDSSYKQLDDPALFLHLACNLVDRTMSNQNGVLDVIPINGPTYDSFFSRSSKIGMSKQKN